MASFIQATETGVVDLAMLAHDVLDAIAAGEQPDGLTTDYLIKPGFPAIWSDSTSSSLRSDLQALP
ncbi:MAG: hypothetical protein AAF468_22115 [Pseudomonadota bacterium]